MEVGLQSFSNNMLEMWAFRQIFLLPEFPTRFQHTCHGSWIHSARKGCFSNNMDPTKRICFPPFCVNRINRTSLEQSAKRKSDFVANYPSLANTIMVSTTVTSHSANTIASAKNWQNLLLGPNKEKHPLTELGNLQLLAWTVSGKDYMQEFRKNLPLLS